MGVVVEVTVQVTVGGSGWPRPPAGFSTQRRGEANPSVGTRVSNNRSFFSFPAARWAWHTSWFAQLPGPRGRLPK